MPPRSRRALLRLAGSALAAATAGCLGDGSGQTSTVRTTTRTTEPTTDGTTETTTGGTTTTPPPERAAWQFRVGERVALGPALRDDVLFVGGPDGVLHALDPNAGEILWSADVGSGFFGGTGYADRSPLVVDGRVFLVSGVQSGAHGSEFRAVALDAATGETLWSKEGGYPKFLTLLGVVDGLVLVATSDDNLTNKGETLYALEAVDGTEQWTAEVGDPHGAAVGGDGVYVGASTGLRAIGLDGTTRWTRSGHLVDGVDAGHGNVYAGFEDDGVTFEAVDPATGETRWSTSGWIITSQRVADYVYVGGEHVVSYAADGTERWRYGPGALVTDAPVTDDTLYGVTRDGIVALSTRDGGERWRTQAHLSHGMATDGSVLAYPAEDATAIHVIDAATGEGVYAVEFDAKRRPGELVVADDTVYVGTSAGDVYALE